MLFQEDNDEHMSDLRKEFTIKLVKNLINHDKRNDGIFSLYSSYSMYKFMERKNIVPYCYYYYIHDQEEDGKRNRLRYRYEFLHNVSKFPELKYAESIQKQFEENEKYIQEIYTVFEKTLSEFNEGVNPWSCLCTGCVRTILRDKEHCKDQLLVKGVTMSTDQLCETVLGMITEMESMQTTMDRIGQTIDIFRIYYTNPEAIVKFTQVRNNIRQKLEAFYLDNKRKSGELKIASIMAKIFLEELKDVLYV
jgi:hypothetical protein